MRMIIPGLIAGFLMAAPPASHANQVERLTDTSRVVAVGGAVTEIVYALGVQDRLLARDSTSVYPSDALALPDVGYMRQLSPESVLSLNPSGIIALEGSGPKEAVAVLKAASVPYVEVPEQFDRNGIVERIRAVGHALDLDEKAAVLAGEVDAKLVSAEKAAAGIDQRARVLFILSMQGGKIMASGKGTAADGILALAGADNALTGYQGYKQVADEAVLTAAPDVILMMDRGGGHGISDEALFAHPAIASTPAGNARRIVRMDGSYLLGFGPRTAEAVHDLTTSLYGQGE